MLFDGVEKQEVVFWFVHGWDIFLINFSLELNILCHGPQIDMQFRIWIHFAATNCEKTPEDPSMWLEPCYTTARQQIIWSPCSRQQRVEKALRSCAWLKIVWGLAANCDSLLINPFLQAFLTRFSAFICFPFWCHLPPEKNMYWTMWSHQFWLKGRRKSGNCSHRGAQGVNFRWRLWVNLDLDVHYFSAGVYWNRRQESGTVCLLAKGDVSIEFWCHIGVICSCEAAIPNNSP